MWRYFFVVFLFFPCFPGVLAATAEQWRGRSIYQVITDRFLSNQSKNACDPGDRTWCGGSWKSILHNLDYIQEAGFTAIWISPIHQNYDGPPTVYGDPYHGYWMKNQQELNSKFGTELDLKALIAEIHARNMYIMVDIVVNNVMATSTSPDYSQYMVKDATLYHPYCPIQYGNVTSEQNCWMGDENVTLPDLNTQRPEVIAQYGNWIEDLVKRYHLDGLRIDAAKHVNMDFWPKFCARAGVFCMGEVYGGLDIDPIAAYQGPQSLDSVLNFPMYHALVDAFSIPGSRNATILADTIEGSKRKFNDTTLLGNFIENHDLPRWRNISVDVQSLYAATTFNFMSDGIPIVYYGQECGFTGSGDPYNREPLWPSRSEKTGTYTLISQLNQFRNFLVNSTSWATSPMQLLTTNRFGIAIYKGGVITVLTNIGSPPQEGAQIGVHSPFLSSTVTYDILTCQTFVVGSSGYINVAYPKGGRPVVLATRNVLSNSGICESARASGSGSGAANQNSGYRVKLGHIEATVFLILVFFGHRFVL